MRLRISKEHIPENIIIMMMFLPSLYYSLANLVGGYTILYIICFGCGMLSYVVLLRNSNAFLALLSFGIMSMLYSYVINPQFGNYIISGFSIDLLSKSKLVLLWLLYFPLLAAAASKELDFRYLLDRLFYCSLIVLPLDIYINYQRMQSTVLTDYMTIAYQILFWVFIAFLWEVQNKKRATWVLIGPAMFMLIVGGSRGALLCLITMLLLTYVFVYLGKVNKKSIKTFVPVLIALAAILVIFNMKNVLGLLEMVTSRMGYNSRVLTQISNINFFNNEDRVGLQMQVIPHLGDKVFGFGLFGDRFLISSGQYIHNFFLELLTDFGLIIGGAIIIYIIVISFKAVKICWSSKNSNAIYFIIISIVFVYVKFMISASYLESTECFFAVGILYNIVRFRGGIKYET